MWGVLYDDGMSLTTASERIARSLAEAERKRGRSVTVRRLDNVETHPPGTEKPARPPWRGPDDGPVRPRGADKPSVPGPSRAVGGTDSVPEPELIRPERFAEPEAISEPQPTPTPELTQVSGPTQAVKSALAEPASVSGPASEASPPELTGEPEPARATTPTIRRRLLIYVLAAVSIVVAAALADHWGVLPRIGASTSSSSTQVGGPPHRPQLIPPLDQPPVMHVGNAVSATSKRAEPAAQPTSPAAGPSGVQNPTARQTRSSTFAEKPRSATAVSASGGPSATARGG